MLGQAPVGVNIPVRSAEVARRFYEDVLGATAVWAIASDVVYRTEGNTFFAIYESVGAGQARHTLATFVVDDIESAVEELRSRGVSIEEYDMPGLKTEDGIAEIEGNKIAWFKDPDGNILSVAKPIWYPLGRSS